MINMTSNIPSQRENWRVLEELDGLNEERRMAGLSQASNGRSGVIRWDVEGDTSSFGL